MNDCLCGHGPDDPFHLDGCPVMVETYRRRRLGGDAGESRRQEAIQNALAAAPFPVPKTGWAAFLDGCDRTLAKMAEARAKLRHLRLRAALAATRHTQTTNGSETTEETNG
jgi:hypothetical protein